MPADISLIVGLGNPGAEYEHTRHNAGAWFVMALAHTAHATLRQESKYKGLHCQAKLFQKDCHLLIPTTYMNLSGQSVQALASYYKIPPEAILIAHDDVDLPAGTIRLKFSGGHGGHNGLRDIIAHLHTPDFYRLRIGVGRPKLSKEVVDYVLEPPNKSEQQEIDAAIERAETIVPLVLNGEIQKAMQALHTNNNEE